MASLARMNNNPLNLRPLGGGEKWRGQTGVSNNSATGAFCVFESGVMGVRAAVINMRSILTAPTARVHTGVGTDSMGRTLRRLIFTWAPPVDTSVGAPYQNHAGAYLERVAKKAGCSPDFDMSPLVTNAGLDDQFIVTLSGIVGAMNEVESGEGMTVSFSEIGAGIRAALNLPPGYVKSPSGNTIRADIRTSQIVDKADTGALLAKVTGVAGAATPLVASAAGADWKWVTAMGVVTILAAVAGFFVFRAIRNDRLRMHREGVA